MPLLWLLSGDTYALLYRMCFLGSIGVCCLFCVPFLRGRRGISLLETAGKGYEAAGPLRRMRQRIYGGPDHAEVLQRLLPTLRPPARREQSCPFVAKEGSPAHVPLPEMRQARAGDGADRQKAQVLLGALRAAVLETFQECQLGHHQPFLSVPQLRNPRRGKGTKGQADDLLQSGLSDQVVFPQSK